MTSTTAPQPTSTPHEELGATTLNQLVRAFNADPGLIQVNFDGRALGSHVVVDGERIEIDIVHVKERDLHLIHQLDATRFGSLDECEICKAEG
jgi:hypothetical protein